MILIIASIGIAYLVAMVFIFFGNKKLPVFTSEEKQPSIKFSIVIPIRNEAPNLPALIAAIQQLNYPLSFFEVLFVNDASSDNSVQIIENAFRDDLISVEGYDIQILPNTRVSGSPKKDAITTAIGSAKYDWIVTTDGDCQVPKQWLQVFNNFIMTTPAKMIAAPVMYRSKGSLIEDFQQLDGLSLQVVTMGSFGLRNPLLCNGANLAYSKEAFYDVHGFSENDHIASGDDIFLLEKMKLSFPEEVHFLQSKQAIVSTQPQSNWHDVIRQRIRWASKTKMQKGLAVKLLGIIVTITNLMVVWGVGYCFFHPQFFFHFLLFFLLKLIIDYRALAIGMRFFSYRFKPLSFIQSMFMYPFILLRVVFASLGGSYSWKGRKFKNPS